MLIGSFSGAWALAVYGSSLWAAVQHGIWHLGVSPYRKARDLFALS